MMEQDQLEEEQAEEAGEVTINQLFRDLTAMA
jgi:hypothetical protein